MSSIEIPKKAESSNEQCSVAEKLSPEEKKVEIERNISVEIERKVIEKYAPLLMLKNDQMTLEEARLEWIKENAIDFRKFFDLKRVEILELYRSENGLEKATDYIENGLENSEHTKCL